MKQLKTVLFAFTLLGAFAISFSACSSDDDDNKTNTVKYQKREITEFKMFVGSDEGGKEVQTNNLDIADYWGDKYFYDTNGGSSFDPDRIYTFDDKNISVTINGKVISTPYKVDGDILYVYDNTDNEWEILGHGTRYSYVEKSHCYKYIQSEGSGWGNDEEAITLDMMLKKSNFGTLANMKNITDTIMWCNVDYIYK